MNTISLDDRIHRLRAAPCDDDLLAIEAVELAAELLQASRNDQSWSEKRQSAQLARMMQDPAGKAFTLAMADQVFRPPTAKRSAAQFRHLLKSHGVPNYLTWPERLAMRAACTVSKFAPHPVMRAITGFMRIQSNSVILPSEDSELKPRIDARRSIGMRMNLNQLGEAILGEQEAENRIRAIIARLESPDCNYISVKLSAIFSQIHLVAQDETIDQVCDKLRTIYRAAMANPSDGKAKFINLDMEEYRDLHLTCQVFQRVLDEPEFRSLEAGIVLQAYLPDSWPVQKNLNAWTKKRVESGGAGIKIRIVKGANLAMELVDAELHDWPCAVYPSKLEVDANYKRMLHEGCKRENARYVRLGVASHNAFDLAYAILLRAREGLEERVDFEMLEGMANHQARIVHQLAGGLLLYAPVVSRDDFHSAIAYLVRRLDENTAPENFLRNMFEMREGDAAWNEQKKRFLKACKLRETTASGPRRTQDRSNEEIHALPDLSSFQNIADTDWSLPHHNKWIREKLQVLRSSPPAQIPCCIAGREIQSTDPVAGRDPSRPSDVAYHYTSAGPEDIECALQCAVDARSAWQALGHAGRAAILRRAAAEIAMRRGEIIATMVLDAGKSVTEADVEISEAIDFANYYADSLREPGWNDGSEFVPLGTMVITPPWNFPFAIPCGGVLAALAAGNTVILKPASATMLTGWMLAQCLWSAGIPREVLQFLSCSSEQGRSLLCDPRIGGVILTGAYETARRFLDWNLEMRLFAETSGKNAMIITAAADPDQAIKDLVKSAFGHSGQKCSAASLAIVEAELYDDPAFLRQLRDAAASLRVGSAWTLENTVTPCTIAPGENLTRGLTQLDAGESWLLEPQMLDDNPQLWSPGIRLGVRPDSWYRSTECFGPVLGLIRSENLEQAIQIQNDSEFGLTGGLQSLDDREIEHWRESVEVGNAYINRPITGAIVRRQPFGGWKKSCFGPGAKAGGPNYVSQFGHWSNNSLPQLRSTVVGKSAKLLQTLCNLLPNAAEMLTVAAENDAYWDKNEFSLSHDPSALRCETNEFRYRRFNKALIRLNQDHDDAALARLLLAASAIGIRVQLSMEATREWLKNLELEIWIEDDDSLIRRIPTISNEIGLLRAPTGRTAVKKAAITSGMRWADGPVMTNARVEWPAWLREQSISQTRHRYGNLVASPAKLRAGTD